MRDNPLSKKLYDFASKIAIVYKENLKNKILV